ncbi:hypothetical protein C7377_1582 [Balneicella halophila]|uniref:Uncharacterized protein n=1 Tax=Balneicella halophila TaxID=1537566 RepID=A0A7L4UN20_BALHA|nr:hypothetical protein [Balneicella halophila]PVX49942.1 hypothetical protein C7377_1582 [Balneicella halophila]
MKSKKNTEKQLSDYFEKEKRSSDSDKLKARIASQTIQKRNFTLRKLAIPIAATVLIALGLSLWAVQNIHHKKQIAQTEILYEDDDFIIYMQE